MDPQLRGRPRYGGRLRAPPLTAPRPHLLERRVAWSLRSATDAGLLASGEKVIAVAGTGRGSDTAVVIQAASSQHLQKLRVHEVLCKPLDPLNLEEVRAKMA